MVCLKASDKTFNRNKDKIFPDHNGVNSSYLERSEHLDKKYPSK